MTKKSAARIQKDILAGKRRAADPIRQVSAGQFFKNATSSANSSNAAERILAECREGAMVPKLETNTCWDDLAAIYREAAGTLMQHTKINVVLRDQELLGFVVDPQTFNTNLHQFTSDLKQLNSDLQQLHAIHRDKTGGSNDSDDLLHSFSLLEQYNLWMQKHDNVLMPTVYHILEDTAAAEMARDAARKAAEALVPPVTDEGLLDGDAPDLAVDPGVLDVNQVTDVDFSDENVGRVVGVPEVKQLRGHASSIYQVDELAFQEVPAEPAPVAEVPHAHHGHGHHNAPQ